MKVYIQQSPFAFSALLFGIIGILMVAAIEAGAVRYLDPPKETVGLKKLTTQLLEGMPKQEEASLTAVAANATIGFGILGLALGLISRFKKEDKTAMNTALIAAAIPVVWHFLYLAIAVLVLVTILNNFEDIFE